MCQIIVDNYLTQKWKEILFVFRGFPAIILRKIRGEKYKFSISFKTNSPPATTLAVFVWNNSYWGLIQSVYHHRKLITMSTHHTALPSVYVSLSLSLSHTSLYLFHHISLYNPLYLSLSLSLSLSLCLSVSLCLILFLSIKVWAEVFLS